MVRQFCHLQLIWAGDGTAYSRTVTASSCAGSNKHFLKLYCSLYEPAYCCSIFDNKLRTIEVEIRKK